MKTVKMAVLGALLALGTLIVALTSPAFAQEATQDDVRRFDASLLGGVQGLTENDTAFPDDFVNIPISASLGYRLTSLFALEGEVAWLIPVANSVSTGSGTSEDLKNPDVLSYQANVRVHLPIGEPALSPYVTAGAGAMTFLSATDPENYPQLESSETSFAINFGLGANVPLTPSLWLRADFREFVAFPQDDTVGLSNGTEADPIWMPRGVFGLTYRF